MIRDFQYSPSASQLTEVLQRFDLDYHSGKSPVEVLRFEVLSPDSFVWKLILGNVVYYLYAEDYVSSLQNIRETLTQYMETDKWEFIPSREPISFESSSPVQGASVYKKPDRADELMEYAVDSGYDFVFLAKSLENPDNAYFPTKRKK